GIERSRGAELSPARGRTRTRRHRRWGSCSSIPLEQRWDHGTFGFLYECHPSFRENVDSDEVAEFHLSRCDEICQREYHVPLDRAFQVTGPVLGISPLMEQEALHLRGAIEHELVGSGGHQDALLHHPELDLQNLLQVLGTERPEYHYFVDAVHELRREFPPRRVYRRAIDFFIQGSINLGRLRRETQAAVHQVGHLTCTEV